MKLVKVLVVLLLLSACWVPASANDRPSPRTWGDRRDRDRYKFLDWLIGGCNINEQRCEKTPLDRQVEYEGYDGWFNNKATPSLGAVDTPLQRLLPPAYHDGVYQPVKRKVNPLEASKRLMNGTSRLYSKGAKTAFLVYFGQQVVEEILDAQGAGCPPEYFNIDIEEDHEYWKDKPHVRKLPFHRTRYDTTTGFSPNNPRQQLNEITPYLDGGLVYGTSKGWADVLRTSADGTLAPNGRLAHHDKLGRGYPAQNTQGLPMANPPAPTNHSQYIKRGYTAPVERFFKLGNPRGNENPFLLSFGIMWFRWHNHIADYLHSKHSKTWSDERIFNEARKWVIATYQSVVMYDWLPKFVRDNPTEYEDYNPNTNPQVSHVFQSAAMRFGHTLVTSGGYLRERNDQGCNTLAGFKLGPDNVPNGKTGVRTCNSYWRSPEFFTSGPNRFEMFLMGLSSQSSEHEDEVVVEDLREKVFGPLEFSRRDLMAINIQRGRDHGLPDYNTARKHFGLPTLESLNIEEFKNKTGTEVDDDALKELRDLYKDPSEVDIWPGGLLETTKGPGQLFSKIILDQFQRTRDGDRYWFENKENGLFTAEERSRTRQVKIIDIVLSVTKLIAEEDIQEDPFTAVHTGNNVGDNCRSKLNVKWPCTLMNGTSVTCKYLAQLTNENTERCSSPDTYDYFTGSEISYILIFTILVAGCVGLVLFVILQSILNARPSTTVADEGEVPGYEHKAKERVAARETRDVFVDLDSAGKKIRVLNLEGRTLTTIDFAHIKEVSVKHLENYTKMVHKIPNHYDLFLIFHDKSEAQKFKDDFEKFCKEINVRPNYIPGFKNALQSDVMTIYRREAMLADFSRIVLSNAFDDPKFGGKTPYNQGSQLLSMEITKTELAQELGMLPDSLIVEQLFQKMDKDKNGFITIKEFWEVMVVFAKGTRAKKAELLFSIYDLKQNGSITSDDLARIIKSNFRDKNLNVDKVVKSMYEYVGLAEEDSVDFEKFKQIFAQDIGMFENICLDHKMSYRESKPSSTFSLLDSSTLKAPLKEGGVGEVDGVDEVDGVGEVAPLKEDGVSVDLTKGEKEETQSSNNKLMEQWYNLSRWIRNNEQYFFWAFLYTLVMFGIFIERCYHYLVEEEHGGLRRVAGLGVTFTRGAASAMMFNYSSLLVTMCRYLLSFLRSSVIHRYFPFDGMLAFHRYMGSWALFWTILHVVGHAINFYHVSTQTPADLICLFREYFRASHILPKFHYWCLETSTGWTGVALTIQAAVIYAFAYKARKHSFKWFWNTHNTYPIFYLLIAIHGSGRLVQEPFFHFFFFAPFIIFACDKSISYFRSKAPIDVISAKHLPSDVTFLKIRRPNGFCFKSGQWVSIASCGISKYEYHPFTLSSAPDETDLTVHIRAVGPWTRNVRKIYRDERDKYPQIYLDGPFGDSHQNWRKFETVVFVAGGIGVTPFSSILKDISHRIENSKRLLKPKKVIFLWVTKNQKQFEWMIDVLKKVEEVDTESIINSHIFITDFKSKYDLRTILLYMAERHFQRESQSGESLFTNLRAITHFGRPDFDKFFRTIKCEFIGPSSKGLKTEKIGVFTCGPTSMIESVHSACQKFNKEKTLFKHHYVKF